MIAVVEAKITGLEGHLSGAQTTAATPDAAASANRRAGRVVDAVRWLARGDRVGRAARGDRVVGRGDRADQGTSSGVHRRAAAGRAGCGAAGRRGLPGRFGPLALRCGRAGAGRGAGVVLDYRGG